MIRNFYLSICCFLLAVASIYAQPSNDDCANAIPLSNVTAFCSNAGAYTNVGATASTPASPACWTGANNDVWFSFVAIATDVSIVVLGDVNNGNWGTMPFPEAALYDNCSATAALSCGTDAGADGSVQIFQNNLVVGQTYYIRIDSRVNTTGTFRLCVDNYNAPPNAGSDCPVGTVLCDKSPFTVQSVIGVGTNSTEVDGTCVGQEYASVWYKWTCNTSGTLTFTLTPNNPDDDLDFVVYELPNGLNDCSNKVDLRCMASGENVGQPISTWIACTGATGLNLNSTDLVEMPGCASGDDNFVAALNMVSGRSYALIVNNFSNTGNGFSISFGGSGTFLGPTADFTTDDSDNIICAGQPITFTDASISPIGNIAAWSWNFGLDATPANANTQGSHTVVYDEPGVKSVRLRATADVGCAVTEIQQITVEPCCETVNAVQLSHTKQDLICARNEDGQIVLDVSSNQFLPHTYQWSDGSTQGPSRTGLGAGIYTVTFTDAIGCDTTFNVTIISPPFFQTDTILDRPTCSGGQDGGIILLVSGGQSPYQYNWSPVSSTTNGLTNIPNGFYSVTVTDALGCDTSLTLRVWELELILDTLQDFLIQPLCYGDANGSITATVGNGAPPYLFDWGNGQITQNSLLNLTAGTYFLTSTDDNLCQGQFVIELPQPDSLTLTLQGTNISCFDGSDGNIQATLTGGVGGYSYIWSVPNETQSLIENLPAGFYSLSATDANACAIGDTITLTEPPALVIEDIDVTDALCYGGGDGQLSVTVSGGTPPFTYSIDDTTFQVANTFPNLPAGNYIVTVQDDLGCLFEQAATINQPWEFIVDAGENVTIDLGFSTDLLAQVNTLDSVAYTWSPTATLSCERCNDPTSAPVFTTTYQVQAVNPTGCIALDSVTVFVNPKKPLFVPNVFTPNYDGINDFFYVQGNIAIRQIRVMNIFDRWGNAVFRGQNLPANDEAAGWDGNFRGQIVNPGVFAYYIEVEFLDDEVVVLQGDVTLVR